MKTVQVAGADFRVLDAGAGKPVLLVHGFPLDHDMWSAQTEFLVSRYRVIAPDLHALARVRPPWAR